MSVGQKNNSDFIAILDNVRSLHNVGSIFRTADGVGVKELVLCGITGCPPRNEIRKAALGAEEAVPWHYEKSALIAIEKLREAGYFIIALEKTEHSQSLYNIELRTPLALVVGHEFNGISPEVLAAADMVAHLPMHGTKISLNVSVAFGVAVYEVRRRLRLIWE